jgi:peptidoglycan/xylan/chitin deacetylase (PgdA/CDA1 family)
MTPLEPPARSLPRRTFLAGALVAVGTLASACGDGGSGSEAATTSRAAASSTTAATAPAPAPTAPPTVATTAPPTARFVASGPSDQRRIALTFHTNGDLDLAGELLDVLDQRHVRMTSFIVGNWLEANPDMATRIADGGHEFANHTYTHPTFGQLSPDAMLAEIVQCRDVLTRLTGGPGAAFRPSGTDDGTASPGEQVLDLAAQAGYGIVLGFDVDPLDYNDPGADAVVQGTLATVGPGSIVSLHFGHPGTIAALPAILDGLDAKNLEPVTVSTLLA